MIAPMHRLLALVLLAPMLAWMALAGERAIAADPLLVPDVSNRQIAIQYSFRGEELLLFGAIVYPGGRQPNDRADIVVVIKGPTQPIRLREKQRVAGIWVNADSVRFATMPGFYALASSRPIRAMIDERTAAIYEIGLENLSMSPVGFETQAQLRRFEHGLADLKARQSLFIEREGAVTITDGVLYSTRLTIPARVPEGTYTAETYLISGGKVLAVGSREIEIRKTGFDWFVAFAADNYGILYGLSAVGLALGLGWAAGWAFRNR